METSIITTIQESGTGKKRKRSFTNINPDATNTELKNFAQTFVGLTTGQYLETERVDKINVDSGDTRKQFRNVSVSNATPGSTATITINIIEGGTVNPAIFFYTNDGVTVLTATDAESTDPKIAKKTVQIPNSAGTMFIGITGGTNFYSEFISTNVQ